MARKETVVVLDDLSGESGASLRKFGFDGVSYEIDLTDDNHAELRKLLTDYIAAARKAIDTPATRSAARKADAAELAANRQLNREIKQWARDNGYSVADRGRLPVEVLAAWKAAHEGSSNTGTADTNGSTGGSTNVPPQQQHEHAHHAHEQANNEVRVDVPQFSASGV